jgi:hypothetical protein
MLVRTQIGGTVDTRKRFAYDPVALNMILVPEPQPLYGRAASQVRVLAYCRIHIAKQVGMHPQSSCSLQRGDL